MTARSTGVGAGVPPSLLTSWAAALLLLVGCAGGTAGGSPVSSSASAPPTAPAATPTDDGPVATDGPRPTHTDVVVSFAGWEATPGRVVAAGYVSPVVEEGGTCTVELRQGSRRITTSVTAIPDATTTVCPQLVVPGSDVESGIWEVVLRYRSATASGKSSPVTVEVPA